MSQRPTPARPSIWSAIVGLLTISLAIIGLVTIVMIVSSCSTSGSSSNRKQKPTPTLTAVTKAPSTGTATKPPAIAASSLSQMQRDRIPPSDAPQTTDTGPVVRAGAFCTHLGDHARTSAGADMRCSLGTDGRKRWTRS